MELRTALILTSLICLAVPWLALEVVLVFHPTLLDSKVERKRMLSRLRNWHRTHTLILVIRMLRAMLLQLQSLLAWALLHQAPFPQLGLLVLVIAILQILAEIALTITSNP